VFLDVRNRSTIRDPFRSSREAPSSCETTNTWAVRGSDAIPPQFAPPRPPGNTRVLFRRRAGAAVQPRRERPGVDHNHRSFPPESGARFGMFRGVVSAAVTRSRRGRRCLRANRRRLDRKGLGRKWPSHRAHGRSWPPALSSTPKIGLAGFRDSGCTCSPDFRRQAPAREIVRPAGATNKSTKARAAPAGFGVPQIVNGWSGNASR